ncbi:MAG TPA: HIT family protein [Acidimicrobiales bacterium]|nr:HIT family protein [Acidimicrobiales bacterium]
MPSVFTKIINGEIPGRFVWRDERAVVFLTIAPMAPGHVMVVPIEEVDHWIDLDPDLAAHLMRVAREVGRAQMQAFRPRRVGMMIAGLEVPHCHLHLVPIDVEAQLSFARADHNPDPAALDDAAERLRAALHDQGHGERVAAAVGSGGAP